MTRYKQNKFGRFPFTTEEELERDAEESQFELDELARKAQKLIDDANSVSLIDMVQALADKANGDNTEFDKVKSKKVR